MQGYLVYKFITVNVENQTGYITLIDAEMAMNFTPSRVNQLVRSLNPIFGRQRLRGFGGGQGPWKIREWEMWY
jgi:bisphosphoglycerate-independent phosphoglycerate mutase (AlkP superfamily)